MKYKDNINLYIEVFSIWIPKIITPISVSLRIYDSEPSKSQIKVDDNMYKKFQFKEIDNEYLVYKIP